MAAPSIGLTRQYGKVLVLVMGMFNRQTAPEEGKSVKVTQNTILRRVSKIFESLKRHIFGVLACR